MSSEEPLYTVRSDIVRIRVSFGSDVYFKGATLACCVKIRLEDDRGKSGHQETSDEARGQSGRHKCCWDQDREIVLKVPHAKLWSCWWSVARQWLVTLGEALCQEGREKYFVPLS